MSCPSDGTVYQQVTETDDPDNTPAHKYSHNDICSILIPRPICKIYLIITCVKEGASVKTTNSSPIKSPGALNHGFTTLVVGADIKDQVHI